MQSKRQNVAGLLLASLMAAATASRANNVCVTNVALTDSDTGYTHVQCDVRWDNSWRASRTEGSTTVTNWDAAWVFVKFRVTPGGAWQHASLSTNKADYAVPAGAALDLGLTGSKGTGVFLYRSAEGGGSWTNTVKLRWNYKQDGLARTTPVDVSVHAIEMVYVPQGSFYLGDGGVGVGRFETATNGTPFQVTSDYTTITLGGGGLGSLGNNNTNGMMLNSTTPVPDDFNDFDTKTLPAAFPKGYNAFYCMKYELSQGQYAEFLNQLTPSQAATHYSSANYGQNRYTITNMASVYVATAPDYACNWLSWANNAAYADWAGLRPMTEFEFEKACRGPLAPVLNECAWGTTTCIDITGLSGTDGSGSETALPSNANCNFQPDYGYLGPVRCGIFATASSGRVAAGASYWGIMEMSGNLWERTVTVGNPEGRSFMGTHGDGTLASNGTATGNTDWPTSAGLGAGFRGANWRCGGSQWLVSNRILATSTSDSDPFFGRGWRGVRSAP